MTLVTLDILRILHPKTKIRVDEHHASIDLPDLTRVIDRVHQIDRESSGPLPGCGKSSEMG